MAKIRSHWHGWWPRELHLCVSNQTPSAVFASHCLFLYFLISRYIHTWISFLYSGFNKITYDCRTDRRTREKINKRSSIEAVSCFLTVRDHKSIHPFCNAVMLPLLSEDKSPVHRNISTYSNKPITPKVNTESPVHLFSKCVKVQSLGTLGGSWSIQIDPLQTWGEPTNATQKKLQAPREYAHPSCCDTNHSSQSIFTRIVSQLLRKQFFQKHFFKRILIPLTYISLINNLSLYLIVTL